MSELLSGGRKIHFEEFDMPDRNKRKTDHAPACHDGAGANSSAPESSGKKHGTAASDGADKKHACGEKHAADKEVRFPLRSHRDGICEVKTLPDDSVEIYRKASFVLYKNDRLKCYFIAAEDYHTETHKLAPSAFDHSPHRHSRGAGHHEPPAGKYYAGVCWSIELDAHGRKIVFALDDYHSNLLKLPFGEADKMLEMF